MSHPRDRYERHANGRYDAAHHPHPGADPAEQPLTEAMTRADPSMLPTVNRAKYSDWVLDERRPGDGPSDVGRSAYPLRSAGVRDVDGAGVRSRGSDAL